MKANETAKATKKSFSFASIAELGQNMAYVCKMTLAGNSKRMAVALLLLTFVTATLSFIRSGANGLLVNELTKSIGYGQFSNPLLWTIALMVFAYAIPSLVWSFRHYCEKRIYISMGEIFEMILLKKRASLDIARHEEPRFQDLLNHASDRGISPLLNLMDGIYNAISTTSGVIIASVILLSIDSRLWIMVLLGDIPSLITQLRYGRDVWGISDSQSPLRRQFYDLRNRFYGGSRLLDLKLFQNVENFVLRVEQLLSGFNKEHKLNEGKKLRAQIISGIISTIAVSSAVLLVTINVVQGNTQIGTWLFITGTMFSLQGSLSGLFNCIGTQYANSLFVTDIRKVLATEPIIKSPKDGIKVCATRVPTIEFRNVSFSYPGSDKQILRNFSLTVRPGEITALVGDNGAGKTTLSALLLRVYDVTSGSILIDGVDIKKIDLNSLYAIFAVLAQSIPHYNFTVAEIIALGRGNQPIDQKRVVEAARFAQAEGFIDELEGGYNQLIGRDFGGINLSGGQMQRLALARLHYRDAQVLILDEPTAATDARSETEIFGRIHGLHGRKSAILITHNFANVIGADRICVMDDGRMIEVGSHRELLAHGGVYATLFGLQAGRFQQKEKV